MKTYDIKNKLNKELNIMAPKAKNSTAQTNGNKASNKKYVFAAIAAVLVIAVVVAVVAITGQNNNPNDKVNAEPSFVAIDINPSFELLVDSDGKVASVQAVNDDAELVIYGEEGIVGATLEDATKKIINLSVQYGYITDENSDVNIVVEGEASVDVYSTVESAVKLAAGTLDVVVAKGTDPVLQHEVDNLKAANPNNSDYQALTTGKLRLIKAAMAGDRTLTMDAAVKMTNEELCEKVEAKHAYYAEKLDTAAELAILAAENAYEVAKATIMDSVYAQVMLMNLPDYDIIKTSLRTADSVEYLALNSAIRTLNYVADILQAYMENPVINSDDILNTLNLVGVTEEEVNAFKAEVAENGEITATAVQGYIRELSAKLATVSEDTAEYDEINAQLELAFEVNDGMTSSNLSLSLAATADVSALTSALSSALSSISAYLGNIKVPTTVDEWKELTIEEYNAIINSLTQKATEVYEDLALTEEELAKISDIQQTYSDKFTSFEESMNSAIAKAKADASSAVEAAKKARAVEFGFTFTVSDGTGESDN